MTAILERYPAASPHVAGDVIAWEIQIDTPADITGWPWAAAVRDHPSGPVIAHFTVEMLAGEDHVLVLRMGRADSAKLANGMGFDLRQTAQGATYLTVTSLNVIPSFSYDSVAEG